MTSYGYDVQDHLVSVTDGEGSTTTYSHSDRDLITEGVSPVSGVTSHGYDEHGSLSSTADARPVTVTRTYDAADRLTLVDYPDPALDTSYTYDDSTVPFSKGRLTAITRDGLSIGYAYDRFGRTTRDGELTYAYDKNGNRIEIGYPGGAVARYMHDFADREATLEFEPPDGSPEIVVGSATYLPGGPLSSLALGNGLTETRLHDQRYHPARITVAPTGGGAPLLDWQYTTDGVGNPTFINDLLGAADRQYGYQDVQYYLTQGNGPWGTLSWTYDRTGNRLSESRDGGAADVYSYQKNGLAGNTAKLTLIQHGGGGTTSFAYDAAGNQTQTNASGTVTDWSYDDDSRLSRVERVAARASSAFRYDGRSFLRLAEGRVPDTGPGAIFCDGFESGDTSVWGAGPAGACFHEETTVPTYESEGRLNARDSAIVLYFADRPIALVGSGIDCISVDHLGSPILFTASTPAVIWEGGFEPFGEDYAGSLSAGLFLRFPGQWSDSAWSGLVPKGLYYNVHRWYESGAGRYTRSDPAGRGGDPNPYLYGEANPVTFSDALGLLTIKGASGDRKSDIEAAVALLQLELTQRPCCVGSDETAIDWQSLLNDPGFTIEFRPKLKLCGKTPPLTMMGIRKVILLGPQAWTSGCCPGGKAGINSLASTILHEIGHAAERSFKHPWDAERRCFGCRPTTDKTE